jgi:hypothetical protein
VDPAGRGGGLLISVRSLGIAAAVALLATAASSPAATQPPPGNAVSSSNAPSAYLITIGPGDPVWTRFGHSALVIAGDGAGSGIAYNYGMFSFQQEHFVLRFLQGRMMYWMHGFPADAHLREHRAQDRTIWIQELALTPSQRDSLARFLTWNDRDENRYYRYDYYLDNCATRIRDALDLVLGGRIREQTDTPSSDAPTYRFHTRRSFAGAPLVYAGTLLALGQPVDRRTTAWEEMWLPEAMQRHLRSVTVTGADGMPRPVVRSERVLFEGSHRVPDQPPGGWTAGALAAALALSLVAIGAVRRWDDSRTARLLAFGITWLWAVLAGVLGSVALALWTLTDHWATDWNENLLQFSPAALLLAVMLPFAFLARRRWRRAIRIVAVAIATGSVLGALLQVLPWFSQVNGPIVAAGLPLNLALAAFAIRLEAASTSNRHHASGGTHAEP